MGGMSVGINAPDGSSPAGGCCWKSGRQRRRKKVGDAEAREAREEEEAEEEEEGEVEEEAMGVDGTRGKGRMLLSFGWGKTKPWVTKGRRRRSRGSRAGRSLREGGEGVDMEGRGKRWKGEARWSVAGACAW